MRYRNMDTTLDRPPWFQYLHAFSLDVGYGAIRYAKCNIPIETLATLNVYNP
jgi:hypothetical protein